MNPPVSIFGAVLDALRYLGYTSPMSNLNDKIRELELELAALKHEASARRRVEWYRGVVSVVGAPADPQAYSALTVGVKGANRTGLVRAGALQATIKSYLDQGNSGLSFGTDDRDDHAPGDATVHLSPTSSTGGRIGFLVRFHGETTYHGQDVSKESLEQLRDQLDRLLP